MGRRRNLTSSLRSSPPVVTLFLFTLTLSIGVLTPLVYSNSDVNALSAFKRGLSDPGNNLRSWDEFSVDPCAWIYVTCNKQNKVTRLDTGSLQLSGKLAPELGNLDQLQYLQLYQNELQGSIPAEFGKLKNLIVLDLYKNNLSGGLPASLQNLKSLRYLRVNDNRLMSGVVPKGLLRIPALDITNTGLRKPPTARPIQ